MERSPRLIVLMSALSCLTFSYTKGDLDFTYVTSRIIGKCLVFISCSSVPFPPAADRLNLFSLCVTSPSDVLSSGQRWHRIQESGGWHPELFGFQTSWPLHSIQPVTQVIPNCQVSQSGKEFSPWGRVLEDTVASLFVWLGGSWTCWDPVVAVSQVLVLYILYLCLPFHISPW